jgi:hypothetical protein
VGPRRPSPRGPAHPQEPLCLSEKSAKKKKKKKKINPTNPSKMASSKRIQKELGDMAKDTSLPFTAVPKGDDLFRWTVMLQGPVILLDLKKERNKKLKSRKKSEKLWKIRRKKKNSNIINQPSNPFRRIHHTRMETFNWTLNCPPSTPSSHQKYCSYSSKQ